MSGSKALRNYSIYNYVGIIVLDPWAKITYNMLYNTPGVISKSNTLL